MSAEAYREDEMYREVEPDIINIKRNPYLVDYEQQRRLRGYGEQGTPRGRRMPQGQGMPRGRRMPQGQGMPQGQRMPQGQGTPQSRRMPQGQGTPRERRMSQGMPQGQEVRRTPQRRTLQTQEMRKARAERERRLAAARRRRIVRMQRMVLFAGVFCIALLCGILYMKRMDVRAEASGSQGSQVSKTDDILSAVASGMVQGLPAAEFAQHPEWEENFLTINEYSRPGETLEEVNSIFVHYTANPNTSAAQNRSYFEQLKDTHITSASAHFIIGYSGEIVQCIPLDEIAYAVQTRNYDSVSIECCYQSADGSFTQETYDSLIELLAWLTDAYDLTTDDILRHYDCGGKKCPIYYTEHEDAWARLKRDVGEKL